MKTQALVIVILFLLFSLSCSKKKISDYEKEQALEKNIICKQIANDWLTKLDSTNYFLLSSLQDHNNINVKETLSYISEAQKIYGKINSRKYFGSHIWFNRKLLTYAPEVEDKDLAYAHIVRSKDGFYIVNPRYFGLKSYRQIFSANPDGEYLILMYQSSPTNKSYAEERLTLWKDPQGIWKVIDYKISDNI